MAAHHRHRSTRHHDTHHRHRHHESRHPMKVYVGYDLEQMTELDVEYDIYQNLPDLANGTAIVGVRPDAFNLLQGYFRRHDFQDLLRLQPCDILQCIIEAWSLCQTLGLPSIQKELLGFGQQIYHGTYGGRHKCAIERPVNAWNFVHANFGSVRMRISDFLVSWVCTACQCTPQELAMFWPEDQQRLVDYLHQKRSGRRGFDPHGLERSLKPSCVYIMPPGGEPRVVGPQTQRAAPEHEWFGQQSQHHFGNHNAMHPQQQSGPREDFEVHQAQFQQQFQSPQFQQQQQPGGFHEFGPDPGMHPQQQTNATLVQAHHGGIHHQYHF